jgi:cysteine synthase A
LLAIHSKLVYVIFLNIGAFMIIKTTTDLIGNTPIFQVPQTFHNTDNDIFIKLEQFNIGGSVKDRIAKNIILQMEKQGLIKKGDTLIEATSGNTGIGLAQVAASRGYKLVAVMSEAVSIERRKLMQAYGATVVLTPKEGGIQASFDKMAELVQQFGYVQPLQFENLNNPAAHYHSTALEIEADFGDTLDFFVAGVGTGGTITGTSSYFKDKNYKTKFIAVEPAASAVLSGNQAAPHMIQGIGAGIIPPILKRENLDQIMTVENEQAIETSRRFAKEVGILLGFSGGANLFATIALASQHSKQKFLTVAPDNGERYLSTTLYESA